MIQSILLQAQAEDVLNLIDKFGVGLVVLVFLGFFSWFLIKWILIREEKQEKKIDLLIDKLTNGTTKKEDEHNLNEYARNANRVQQLTYFLLNEFDADRVSIFEYHNGGKTLAGISFNKCSNTYEALAMGIDGKYNELQQIPISINFLWNKLLEQQKPIIISDIEILKEHDETIYFALKGKSIKSYYSQLIVDYNSRPIGFITIEYYDNVKVLNIDEIKIFNDTSIKIGGLLNK
ncbi:hypothetical protein M0Q50_04535 [bacterium]|jgi:hypothetical protein|nr:hypothetical protein [bacterium]